MHESLDYSSFEKRYKNKEYIGSGGFGKVYKVFDYAINHYVALKVSDVRPEWSKFTLKNEVELVNRMDKHRNIARYDACYRYNTGITGEMDFAILKFYEDGNLEQFLKSHTCTFEDKKLIIQGVLEGVQFLHRNNVIHRDMKAQNILMSREDGVWCPKITDFGLSREVGIDDNVTNSAVGISYAYAAPEQILNQKIYKNVDIWAAGVMIYRIIQDELPFKGTGKGDDKSAQSQLELSNKIVNIDLPLNLETMVEPYRSIVKRCLVKDPQLRAQTCDELLDILHGKRNPKIEDQNSNEASGIVQKESEDITELIINEPERLDSSYEPVASAPPPPQKTPEVVDHFPPPLEHTYESPNSNPTQIISPQEKYEVKQEVEKEFVPNSGADSGGFQLKHILIILGVVVIAVGGYFAVSTLLNEPEKEQIIEEIVYPPIVAKELLRYENFDISVQDSEDLNLIENTRSELLLFVENNNNEVARNYRLTYLQAKLELYYPSDHPGHFKHLLDEAEQIASANGQEKEMLEDMQNDSENDLSAALEKSKKIRTEWKNVEDILR